MGGEPFSIRVGHPDHPIGAVVRPQGGIGPYPADCNRFRRQPPAQVIFPQSAAAGVDHAGAPPDPVGPLVVAVADRGGVGGYGGAIPGAGVAVALPHQAVEAVVGQAG